jgi:hypothetical protein
MDNIVDDVSDGDVDEEEAERQRVAMEIREDTERTLAVIAAVTEGRRIQAEESKEEEKAKILQTKKRPLEEIDLIEGLRNRCDAFLKDFNEDTHSKLLLMAEEVGEGPEEQERAKQFRIVIRDHPFERQKRQKRQERCDAKVKASMDNRELHHLKSRKLRRDFHAVQKARGFLYRW